jgi:hypothetical protein
VKKSVDINDAKGMLKVWVLKVSPDEPERTATAPAVEVHNP